MTLFLQKTVSSHFTTIFYSFICDYWMAIL